MIEGLVHLKIEQSDVKEQGINQRDLIKIRNKVKDMVGISGCNAPKKFQADLDLNVVNKILPEDMSKEMCLMDLSKLTVKNNKYLTKSEYFKMTQKKENFEKKKSRIKKTEKTKTKKKRIYKKRNKKRQTRIKIKMADSKKKVSKLKAFKDKMDDKRNSMNLDMLKKKRSEKEKHLPNINQNSLYIWRNKTSHNLRNKKEMFIQRISEESSKPFFKNKSNEVSKVSKNIFFEPKSKSCK
jgi:hypothetical protein